MAYYDDILGVTSDNFGLISTAQACKIEIAKEGLVVRRGFGAIRKEQILRN